MFTDEEHKFIVYEFMFKGREHKFTECKYKM